MLSDLASSAKYLVVKRAEKDPERERYKQKRNVINLLHCRSLQEEEHVVLVVFPLFFHFYP